MNPSRARRWMRSLRFAPWVIVALAISALSILLWPRPAWTPPLVELRPSSQEKPIPAESHDLAGLAVIWQRDLRQAVVDAPPPAPLVVPQPELGVQLVGTAVEAEQCFGVFRLADNRTLVRSVGGNVGGFEVLGIERGQARLRGNGREVQLRVPWFERIQPDSPDEAHE